MKQIETKKFQKFREKKFQKVFWVFKNGQKKCPKLKT